MAFDGTVVAALAKELRDTLTDARIYKIAQPETDELLFTIKANKTTYRLLMSASASLPLLYLTAVNKPSPLTAPNFCMLLRKHISGGRIVYHRQHQACISTDEFRARSTSRKNLFHSGNDA